MSCQRKVASSRRPDPVRCGFFPWRSCPPPEERTSRMKFLKLWKLRTAWNRLISMPAGAIEHVVRRANRRRSAHRSRRDTPGPWPAGCSPTIPQGIGTSPGDMFGNRAQHKVLEIAHALFVQGPAPCSPFAIRLLCLGRCRSVCLQFLRSPHRRGNRRLTEWISRFLHEGLYRLLLLLLPFVHAHQPVMIGWDFLSKSINDSGTLVTTW